MCWLRKMAPHWMGELAILMAVEKIGTQERIQLKGLQTPLFISGGIKAVWINMPSQPFETDMLLFPHLFLSSSLMELVSTDSSPHILISLLLSPPWHTTLMMYLIYLPPYFAFFVIFEQNIRILNSSIFKYNNTFILSHPQGITILCISSHTETTQFNKETWQCSRIQH